MITANVEVEWMSKKYKDPPVVWILLGLIGLVVLLTFASKIRDRRYGPPINFYGRIVDSSGRPVGGVTVDIQVLHYTSLHVGFSGNEEVVTERVTSDANGDFELTRGSGMSLSIVGMAKNGRGLVSTFASQDARQPPDYFSLTDKRSRSQLPDTPAGRLVYPVRY
jgi:hypothetical protein